MNGWVIRRLLEASVQPSRAVVYAKEGGAQMELAGGRWWSVPAHDHPRAADLVERALDAVRRERACQDALGRAAIAMMRADVAAAIAALAEAQAAAEELDPASYAAYAEIIRRARQSLG